MWAHPNSKDIMADDIFLTPEEQEERVKRWIRENGPAIAIGIALGLGGIWGYDEYRKHQLQQAEEASLLYSQALEVAASSELADVSAQVETLKEEYAGTPYAAKAMLLRAKQLSVTDPNAALEALDWVLAKADEDAVWHAANIRKAKILLSQEGQAQAVIDMLDTQAHDGFGSHYLEIMGDAYGQLGQAEQAIASYESAIEALAPADAGYARILTLKQNGVRAAQAVDSSESSQAN